MELLPAAGQEVPSEKLSRVDLQEIQNKEWQLQRTNDRVVYDQIETAIKGEMSASSVNQEIAAEQAFSIISLILGPLSYSKTPQSNLRERVIECRRLFDKIPKTRFPETTFFYVLYCLRIINGLVRSMCGKHLRLAALMLHHFHGQREELLRNYRHKRAINVSDSITFRESRRFEINLVKAVLDSDASGPVRARALRRLWPEVVELGLISKGKYLDGATLSVPFLTFTEVESYLSSRPGLSVFGYLGILAEASFQGTTCIPTEKGLESIDKRWSRTHAPPTPKPAGRAYLGKISPIDLTHVESCRSFLSTSQYESFVSPNALPSQKVAALKVLWAKVPSVGIIVGGISCSEGIVIEDAFITFPQTSVPALERLFRQRPDWRAFDFANLLGFCLRQKQTVFLGGGLGSGKPTEDKNYRIASKVSSVGQAVKHFDRICSAWRDDDMLFTNS